MSENRARARARLQRANEVYMYAYLIAEALVDIPDEKGQNRTGRKMSTRARRRLRRSRFALGSTTDWFINEVLPTLDTRSERVDRQQHA